MSIELIVLGTTKTGDNALVVHTLSREMGRRGFLVRPGKKAAASLFLPLSILEAEVVENHKSELWSLKGISARDALAGIRGNIHKNTMTLFLSEVLFRTLREGMLEDGLYRWCIGSILTLDALEGDFANFHIRWLLELAGALGFRPSWEDVAPFAGDNALALKPFLTADFGGSMLLPLSGAVRNALAESLVRYLEFHTEQPIRVKSLAVLRELYK
ncbi:MAG: DNA repair protein RecO C-terminal domain-containing protein [Bacteroidales bacterium]|nr:DNA repair protein RecO C-terminal domain-containing protein [Bacteroidales bacterium]